ncbi:MAG TPA: L-aspartate oxidase [Longimicrobiales bacterium]|nr:L-aspartate oxidase [Longimicrobiales bacterium]
MRSMETDVLVIGSGIAGLTYALQAAEHGDVCIVTKKERAASSTNYAQGGIAAVMSEDDSAELHIRDTLLAGAGLCHMRAVERLVMEGPARVRDLMEWGVRFSRSGARLDLGREGGHSRRRVVHAGDLTGREIERALLHAVASHPRIRLFEDLHAVDLTVGLDRRTGTERCTGALLLEHLTGHLVDVHARLVLMATGGLGQAYRHTTNPEIATGDGVAMAWRAGVAVANLEFVQFHPTALYPAQERAFLITEAVRGEGAVLRRLDGTELMDAVHHLGSLAPRDIVARAIDVELKSSGSPYVHLDLSSLSRELVERRFPGILAECRSRGLDILSEPIPVVPAAHYSCGGVITDGDGRTSLAGLFAAGEVTCTGVHGANRLASNSLLEAVVYSHRAAQLVAVELAAAAGARLDPVRPDGVRPEGGPPGDGTDAAADSARQQIRDLMWEDAGIVRNNARLSEAARELAVLAEESAPLVDGPLTVERIELRNLLEVSGLIVACAQRRLESRGLHYNTDYPFRDSERFLRDTTLLRSVGESSAA